MPPPFLELDLQELCIVATNSNTIIKTKSKKVEVMGWQRCLNVIWAQCSSPFWKGKDNPLSPLCKNTLMSKGNAHIFCWTVTDSIRHRNSVENVQGLGMHSYGTSRKDNSLKILVYFQPSYTIVQCTQLTTTIPPIAKFFINSFAIQSVKPHNHQEPTITIWD